ncbi:MAG: UDP-N-acetylmuramoyl-L-alanine--D-glutamate ligase [Gammaproteobacteria bacterium]|nr:UDP-N-acetylmuramoyl-L-alanine--D-glutamate ligase [Gammaproteobacteria bacterium]
MAATFDDSHDGSQLHQLAVALPQPVVVVGLGKSGFSCARFLVQRGVPVTVVDSRDEPPALAALQSELPAVGLFTGTLDIDAVHQAGTLIISPGVALSEPAIATAINCGAWVMGDVELFALHAPAPLVAITGSNGKSTVTTLLGEMIRKAGLTAELGGNLGTPALELLERSVPDYYVLELSSFQLETTHSLNASVATVLNVSADHMDRYDSLDCYTESKRAVFSGDGVQVINSDDAAVRNMVIAGRNVIYFGMVTPASADHFGVRERAGVTWLAQGEQLLVRAAELPMPGQHNIANALAALALGYGLGLPMAAMIDALATFSGLPHRTECVAECDGVVWYNDSKATNVGAAVAALEGIASPIVWIAGGEGKGADFTPLRQAAADKVRLAVLMGRDAELIAAALAGVCAVITVEDMAAAVDAAADTARAGDAVLLSPACASFDMYDGYAARGDDFRHCTKQRLAECQESRS